MEAFFSVDRLTSLAGTGLRIAVILGAAFITALVLRRVLGRLTCAIPRRIGAGTGHGAEEVERRVHMLSRLVVGAAVGVVWAVGAMMALTEIGFDLGPLLVGAAILAVAIGLGAQALIRDVLTGCFMLFENQIRVGDEAVVNGQAGKVEHLFLRTTVLRGLDGALHVFPNGKIHAFSNKSHEFSYHVFDLRIGYKEDTDVVIQVLRDLADELSETEPYASAIVEPLDVLGVDELDDSAVILKARIKTKPSHQWKVGREMNRRINKRFKELGIQMPIPQLRIQSGEGDRAFRMETSGGQGLSLRPRSGARESSVSPKLDPGAERPPRPHTDAPISVPTRAQDQA